MTTATTFRCRTCDEEHDIRTAAWGPDAPSPWWSVSDVVRARSELTRCAHGGVERFVASARRYHD